MKTKALLLTLIIAISCTASCFASETAFTGTASCVMPSLFEFNTQPTTQTTDNPQQTIQPPVVSGASGDYEILKEEKLIQTEKTDTKRQVTVYTICAK